MKAQRERAERLYDVMDEITGISQALSATVEGISYELARTYLVGALESRLMVLRETILSD